MFGALVIVALATAPALADRARSHGPSRMYEGGDGGWSGGDGAGDGGGE